MRPKGYAGLAQMRQVGNKEEEIVKTYMSEESILTKLSKTGEYSEGNEAGHAGSGKK